MDDIHERYPKHPVLGALDCLIPVTFKGLDRLDVSKKIDDAVETIREHYCEGSETSGGVWVPALLNYSLLKAQAFHYKQHAMRFTVATPPKPDEAWLFVEQSKILSEDLSEWLKAARLALCIPIGSVENERRFHLMNLVRTELRNRLKTDHLNMCVRVAASGKGVDAIEKFNFAAAFDIWEAAKNRWT